VAVGSDPRYPAVAGGWLPLSGTVESSPTAPVEDSPPRPPRTTLYSRGGRGCGANVGAATDARRTKTKVMPSYEVRPRKDHRGIDLISDALPFGRLWYVGPNAIENAIGYAKFNSRSHDAAIMDAGRAPTLPG
jgi:hypothetical protein